MEKIRSTIAAWCQNVITWIYRKSIVAEYGHLKIVDVREKSKWFEKIIHRSLELIEESDPRRFSRIQNELDWVINISISVGQAQYHYRDRSCTIDFEEPEEEYCEGQFEYDAVAAYYAATIVHEATHGRIFRLSKRHSKDQDVRLREERLCRKEEERFLKQLGIRFPNLADSKLIKLNEERYREIYDMSETDHFVSLIKRLAKRSINENTPTS